MTDKTNDIPEIHFESLSRLEATYWWHQSRLNWSEKIIRTNIPEPSSLNVLDYGCGTGGFLHQLNSKIKFKSCLGVDIAQEAIKRALIYPENFQRIDPFDFSIIPGKDLICLMDALEHIEMANDFFTNLFSQMDKGAHLLISVPAFTFLFSTWDETLGHYRRYEKTDITKLVRDAGGSIKFMEYTFAYLFPALALKRIIGKAQYNLENCEFPSVPPFLNCILLKLNRMEMRISKYLSPPLGSSLFCLVKK